MSELATEGSGQAPTRGVAIGSGQDAGTGQDAGIDAGQASGDDLAQRRPPVDATVDAAPDLTVAGTRHRLRTAAGHAPARGVTASAATASAATASAATPTLATSRQPAVAGARGRDAGVRDAGAPDAGLAVRRSTIFIDAGAMPDALTDDELRAGLQEAEAKLIGCSSYHNVHGVTVWAVATVKPAGNSLSVTLEGEWHKSNFENCLNNVVRERHWPETRNGGKLEHLPLVFP